ncbi:tripartite tricarboxylate transporter TctB family protein [Roseobacter sp. HKCCD9010]|uniref:tripartite tricarboxylate transporter TctB family protein n=1 Tax=unclassified Roseobacter TaxID=196798 RepID=UPI0014913E26|nr:MULTISPECIES: tripartite tricarboxylate transporter TctB family protein [unclassified Roseobacter]MBF9051621.1 tripartite tricarboxylate transporter TctB family protein [Rhodobacterales bacterium HKCCD4356]NNV13145.1 tripartite tricarboxylate transporter TctB family protein [Roseobacter sp. HKCCD7357]NNV17396.1 tripartite tricarboxylate transporter TctB family protein [Roseobacter sp. HKCCD8768]NNV27002.1 tripartite tricarboxylate transporter TctB family protein [Roseobacter sp. HKCCD8192]N
MAHRLLDLAFASLLFGLSIFLWFVADGFPESRRFAQADADFWPKIIFATMALITGIIAVRTVLNLRKDRAQMAGAFTIPPQFRVATVRVGAMGVLILTYFVAFQHVGFILATFAFLILASFVIPYKNNLARVIFAACFTVVLVLFFTQALELPLPRGTGVFYDLNVLFY